MNKTFCDRCGIKIEMQKGDLNDFLINFSMPFDSAMDSIFEERKFDVCAKCRKAFKEFMDKGKKK